MPEDGVVEVGDGHALLEAMRGSRKRPSVLKLDLATMRSKSPSRLIFAVEGDSDKGVYYQWLRCVRPELKYIPFVCDGKAYVLELKAVVERDKGDLGRGVYFFVDRDFDDMRGEPHSPAVFLTEKYSIENYIVDRSAVDATLTNEFNCHAAPEVRAQVCELFENSYSKFLSETADINERLYAARKLRRELRSKLPKKISELAHVSLTDVNRSAKVVSELVDFDDAGADLEVERFAAEFKELNPQSRYRGKFAFLFLSKWLQLLAEARSDESNSIFKTVGTKAKVNHQTLTLELLSTRVAPPASFRAFVDAMPASV